MKLKDWKDYMISQKIARLLLLGRYFGKRGLISSRECGFYGSSCDDTSTEAGLRVGRDDPGQAAKYKTKI